MLILGHRGAPGKKLAENSLPAFRSALEQGADGIELDLRLSRDKEIVVVHDASLHRIAGDAHKTSELTADDLANIPLRHTGNILTLHEVTSSIHEPALLDLEIKHHLVVEPLATKLRTSAGLRERTIVSSFHPRVIRQMKKECPDVRILALVMRWPLPLQKKWLWKTIAKLGVWGVGFPLHVLTPKRVAFLHSMGYIVTGWDRRGTSVEAARAVTLGLDIVIVKDVATAVSLRK